MCLVLLLHVFLQIQWSRCYLYVMHGNVHTHTSMHVPLILQGVVTLLFILCQFYTLKNQAQKYNHMADFFFFINTLDLLYKLLFYHILKHLSYLKWPTLVFIAHTFIILTYHILTYLIFFLLWSCSWNQAQ